MIVVRAPLRISFVGGGTDLPDFYKKYPGKVISTSIDKYVYVVINKTPLINKVSARYALSETVSNPKKLEHTRIKAALLDLGIEKGIEIGFFASLPSKTGLGSSSSFSVALLKGLHSYLGKRMNNVEAAESACRLEIDLVKEPIGKQDQYAAAIGGFNIFQFNPDDTVGIHSVLLDYKNRLAFEDHLLIFYTGITRLASSVLKEQKANIDDKMQTLREMADSVDEFRERLLQADFKGLGKLVDKGWKKKKTLASNVTNDVLESLYDAGIEAGAWGGKVLGAGGGGCILFLVPSSKKETIRKQVFEAAKKNKLEDFQEMPISLTQSGTEILYKSSEH